ncbi:hypothetical protein ANN_14878 [Periplaneta americana]|uniref:Uncharacterized protein n=1 Tax=Periplaneta americana TaxID=6978 RepID=A0ABQ8SXI7_PERAM|nr:hypothetical protein ANN_14878 [Periplaneta americana]
MKVFPTELGNALLNVEAHVSSQGCERAQHESVIEGSDSDVRGLMEDGEGGMFYFLVHIFLYVDKILRSSVKEMLFLPADIPNSMLYTSKKLKGLQLIRASWEALLQHCNICLSLIRADNPHVNMMRQMSNSNRRRGKGVEMYSEVTVANSWIANKKGLSTSEWISSLEMTANLAAVRSFPGTSLDGTRCRHGCPENETVAHVLGFCEQELLVRNSRHHLVRSKIAAALRNKGWIVEEEISCWAENGSTRQVDILAYNTDTKQGIIVDPTIRFEVECHQSAEVHLKKKSIYEPTVNYLS